MALRITHAPTQEEKDFVLAGICEYNRSRFEKAGFEEVAVFSENEEGTCIGGLTGVLRGDWLFIHLLWVAEGERGKGLGRALLQAVEEEGRKFGCRFSFVDTFEFQAPTFYEKEGYREIYSMHVHEETGRHFYYTKAL